MLSPLGWLHVLLHLGFLGCNVLLHPLGLLVEAVPKVDLDLDLPLHNGWLFLLEVLAVLLLEVWRLNLFLHIGNRFL